MQQLNIHFIPFFVHLFSVCLRFEQNMFKIWKSNEQSVVEFWFSWQNHESISFKIICTACSGTIASVDCADEQPIDTSSLGTVNPSGEVTTVVQPVQPIVTTGAPPEMGGGAKGRRF